MNRFLKRTFILPEFILCLLTNFTTKYTYGLLMIQGVSEKYKIADFQEFYKNKFHDEIKSLYQSRFKFDFNEVMKHNK